MDSQQEKPPNPIPSTPVSFLDLPRGVRNNIYKRLLVLRHPLHIFQEPNSPVESFAPDGPIRWLALLYTSRQIYTESRAVLYGNNQFHLEDITPHQTELLRSFLYCIGPLNAASISHLCVNFPVAERIHGEAEGIELGTDSLQTVRLCKGQCNNLATLETVVHYKNSGFFREPDDFLREALRLVNEQLRAIRSLRMIVVRFVDFNGIPTASATTIMQKLGWIVVSRNGLQS
jgi:hypothetical protein